MNIRVNMSTPEERANVQKQYTDTKEKIITDIKNMKKIYKWRVFLSSLSKNAIQIVIQKSYDYVLNEYNNNSFMLSVSEKQQLGNIQNHLQLSNFENMKGWWEDLAYNYLNNPVLQTLISYWIDDVDVDVDVNEDTKSVSTLGIR